MSGVKESGCRITLKPTFDNPFNRGWLAGAFDLPFDESKGEAWQSGWSRCQESPASLRFGLVRLILRVEID